MQLELHLTAKKLDNYTPSNSLLRGIPPHELRELSPFLELVPLTARRVLHYAGTPLEHVYFIEKGLVSIFLRTGDKKMVEVWSTGREGFVGLPVLFGVRKSSAQRAVQIGGCAYRISALRFCRAVQDFDVFAELLYRYSYSVLAQTARISACNLCHPAQQRVARWLLNAQDRCEDEPLPVSQGRLATTLGVRRATICEILCNFERLGFIAKERNLIRLLNRARMQEICCSCYRSMASNQEEFGDRGFVRHNSIPEAYWGTWARSNATCKNEETSVIVLSAHTYVSSETSCTVNYVRTTPGPKGPTCSARLQCSNSEEHAEKKTAANLIIRPGDADQIFVGPEFASLTPYKRCSARAPGAKPGQSIRPG
jgi:CRP-like cAMP-binding protein